ncbi:MAG: class I SAM-dependent methyltransferase [Ectothiorhodospiraceae bacterium]|nr:class I SAM-dependent methyltransferase [Ectothiorhodospiraceae bacterium]
MNNEVSQKVGSHWSKISQQNSIKSLRLRWWQSPNIIRNINQKVAGLPLDGFSNGLIYRAQELAGDRAPFANAISVGCGTGVKEMKLIKQGLVGSFKLYEVSEYRVEIGRELAKKLGVEDRVDFIVGDAFTCEVNQEIFDLIHWDNSLHHMLDTEAAIKWSFEVLKKGGMFYMNDYVGPNYLQFSDKTRLVASKVRSIMPDKYLVDPRRPEQLLSKKVVPTNKSALIASDPSEAADSEKIISSIKKYFPNAEINLTGGAIYHTALSDMISNFEEEEENDQLILDLLMIIDELLIDLGENQYATALAIK